MTKGETLDKVLRMPRDFWDIHTVSILELLKKSGYAAIRDQISEDDIRVALIRCPERIDEWRQYSEDKRTSSGWYLLTESAEKYLVGYSSKGSHSTEKQYSDRFDACAYFIKHEIDDKNSP